ncbi:Thermoresistant gluconokinase [Candidatus Erwinia haradaeae]|uniref:Gluconokinase n=1 Tax=Candidatus Erwinia haradaeae TaxID=1922217 RepID=A0A451DC10_9GAMM|nr:gluconokinase [Candidatus Erwinia haradaeae]VFP83918.1 Thermoresistant gluconokinase [Candidatus Erwinia haradaeae]
MNRSYPPHRVFIFMGVSGSGKSTVATAVAHQLNAALLDGDFLHPRVNIAKMSSGHPLNDNDRLPWLQAINDAVFAMQRTNELSLIVCSALKKTYRNILRNGNSNVSFIYLKGHFETIQARLQARKGHFFQSNMLETQFTILENPDEDEKDVWIIDINQPLQNVLTATLKVIEGVKKNIMGVV